MPKPPICELLNLDQRKLPAEVFDRISDRAGRLKEREERARKAWESFGKPGRDPETVGSLFNLLASNGAWIPPPQNGADARPLGPGWWAWRTRSTPTPPACETAC